MVNSKYNILILGNGGREHALAWKISSSEKCNNLFIAPGNAGTSTCGKNVPIDVSDFKAVADFCVESQVEMIVIGPEVPLVNGIVDFLLQDKRLKDVLLIGPSREGAMLEGSKAFAKEFMAEFGIPTAKYRKFNRHQLAEALSYLEEQSIPVVLKADGLAAGKGVIICEDLDIAKTELREMLDGKFGMASDNVIIEQYLDGREFSMFVLTDGKQYQMLPTAKDYKRIGEGDTGLNTGGMGCVSPVSYLDHELKEKVINKIIEPTVQGIHRKRLKYFGFIFFGLIEVNGDPFVIEYNCRLGDPETQVILPRLKSDLVSLFEDLRMGKLKHSRVELDRRFATAVILASGGYPEGYSKGKLILGLENISESLVFHAGTIRDQLGDLRTNGGRVLAITTLEDDLVLARESTYSTIQKIHFDGMSFRRDIGADLVQQ